MGGRGLLTFSPAVLPVSKLHNLRAGRTEQFQIVGVDSTKKGRASGIGDSEG
jgi:hypothetical protein